MHMDALLSPILAIGVCIALIRRRSPSDYSCFCIFIKPYSLFWVFYHRYFYALQSNSSILFI